MRSLLRSFDTTQEGHYSCINTSAKQPNLSFKEPAAYAALVNEEEENAADNWLEEPLVEFLTPPRRATTCPGLAQEESQPRILLRDLDFFQVDMLGIKESFYVLPVAPATGEDSATIVNSTMPPAKF